MPKTKHAPGIHLHKTEPSVYDAAMGLKPEFYWNLIASNGREICRSSETYTRKENAAKSMKTAANLFYAQVSSTGKPAYYDHSEKDSPLKSYL